MMFEKDAPLNQIDGLVIPTHQGLLMARMLQQGHGT